MNQSKNHIDKVFKRKLRDWSQDPPADVWDNISAELDLSGKKKKRIVWIARIAASVAVVTVLTLGYVFIRNSADQPLVTEEQVSRDSVLKEKTVSPEYTRTDETGTEEKDSKEDLFEGKIIQDGELPVKEKQEMLAEISDMDVAEYPGSDASGHPEDISGSSLPGSVPDYIDMNYISHLDYPATDREGKPQRYDQLYVLPGLTESAKDTDWDDLYVQDLQDQEKRNKTRWAVGTQVSPLYSYRVLGKQDAATQSGSYYDQIESGQIAYSGGVNVKYSPVNRISIQSGIYYSKLGISVDHNYYSGNITMPTFATSSAYKYNSVSNSSGIINIEDSGPVRYVTNAGEDSEQLYFSSMMELNVHVYEGEIIQNFEYLEVPMVIRYKLVDRKLGFDFLGGVSTNFLIGSNAYFLEDNSKEKIGSTTSIKPVNYSSILGFGVGYVISDRLNISVEPTFRYYLNSINKSSPIRSHPYSLGIFTGMSYYF